MSFVHIPTTWAALRVLLGTYSFIAPFVTASISGGFHTPKVNRNEWWPIGSAFFNLPLLPLFREKLREDEGSGAPHQSIHREREWRGSEEEKVWEARFSQGESQQRSTHTRTHVHVRRGRITPIYLARQQPASVCTALTPAQPNCYWSFSSHVRCCLCV